MVDVLINENQIKKSVKTRKLSDTINILDPLQMDGKYKIKTDLGENIIMNIENLKNQENILVKSNLNLNKTK